jgi:hypothetical protein
VGGPGRVVCDSGADLILQLRLERRGDRIKHCWKMKWRQQARLNSMGRKCNTARQRGDVS